MGNLVVEKYFDHNSSQINPEKLAENLAKEL